MSALLLAGWLLIFAEDNSLCMPAHTMREWLQSEGFALNHNHTGLDGKHYEFWANPSNSRAMLVEFPATGPACVADEGHFRRGGFYDDSLPVAQ